MGRSRVVRRIAAPGPRAAGLAAVAVLAGVPVTASAAVHESGAHAAAIVRGLPKSSNYGGLTTQDWPVALRLTSHGTRIAWVAIGLDLKCTSGGVIGENDGYRGVKISKAGRFGAAFGPGTQHNDDGTSIDAQGSFSGVFNRKRTLGAGHWRLKLTYKDATGAVTDTCDSGKVVWAVTR